MLTVAPNEPRELQTSTSILREYVWELIVETLSKPAFLVTSSSSLSTFEWSPLNRARKVLCVPVALQIYEQTSGLIQAGELTPSRLGSVCLTLPAQCYEDPSRDRRSRHRLSCLFTKTKSAYLWKDALGLCHQC